MHKKQLIILCLLSEEVVSAENWKQDICLPFFLLQERNFKVGTSRVLIPFFNATTPLSELSIVSKTNFYFPVKTITEYYQTLPF